VFDRGDIYVYKTHMAAQDTASETCAWLSSADVDRYWPACVEGTSQARAAPIGGNAESREKGELEGISVQRRLRLRRATDFGYVRQAGRSYHSKLLRITLASNDLHRNRYGIIVSKRLGNAIVRNRVRRRLREMLRLLDPYLQPGFDVVVVARQEIVEQPFAEIQRTVKRLLLQAGLFETEGDRS